MAHLLILFFVTFSAAFMTTVPPGLLNMNAAKTSVEKGRTNGFIFSLGVSSTIMLQAYIAVLISKFLHRHPEVVDLMFKLALGVFVFFAIYFFVTARKNRESRRIRDVNFSKLGSFFMGMFLAAINLLTIPYYSGLNVMWSASGWIRFEAADTLVFVLAAGMGTFSALALYTVYFNKMEQRNDRFSKNANYILGTLMLILGVITLFRIFNK